MTASTMVPLGVRRSCTCRTRQPPETVPCPAVFVPADIEGRGSRSLPSPVHGPSLCWQNGTSSGFHAALDLYLDPTGWTSTAVSRCTASTPVPPVCDRCQPWDENARSALRAVLIRLACSSRRNTVVGESVCSNALTPRRQRSVASSVTTITNNAHNIADFRT